MIGTYSASFFLYTILLFLSSFSYTSSLTADLCRPDQRDTLLEFKSEFELRNLSRFGDEMADTCYPKTKSWGNNSDCCYWDGVTCDVNSGVVIGIDLSLSCLHGNFKPKSSLFRLQHLQNLNLAFNNFSASLIPTGLNKLMGLERLNLSRSSFSGQIPLEILHLTKLVSLDLSSPVFSFSKSPFLLLLAQNLTNLRELDLSGADIYSKVPQVITNLTSLRSLHLRGCNLFGRLPRNVLLSPTIQSIDLGGNPDLESSLPEFNGNNSLLYLDLSGISLSVNIPSSISNLKHLNVLRFSYCNFTGKIPSSIGNLSHLTSLYLSFNSFSGEIPSSFQHLKQMIILFIGGNKLSDNFPTAFLNLTKLSYLDISYNQFTGTLPSSLFTLPSLEAINLSDNQLNGTLEFGNISSPSKIQFLDIGRNNFRGPIPRSISSLVNLRILDLSHVNTQGAVDFSIFSHLKLLEKLDLSHLNTTTAIDLNAILSCSKSLSSLDLSGNHVSAANMSLLSDPSSKLRKLNLSSCGIREFPEVIQTQRHMYLLDLSNNKIKDLVPGWLWSLPELGIVDLSNNSFSGFNGFTRDFSRAPEVDIWFLDLSKNNLSGEIPKSICGMSFLVLLDFTSNNFNGTVPYCFNVLIQRGLNVLHLGDNHLSGELPEIFPNCPNLESLDVGHNQLTGKLPRSLSGCSSLEVLHMEENRINDTFPFWLQSLPYLRILVLRSNEFHGSLEHHPPVASWLPHQLQIIDLSQNAFTGTLPSDFYTYWSAMSLERDHSELEYIAVSYHGYESMVFMNKGVQLQYPMIPKIFAAIDLSGNKLRGRIPESIGLLKSLIVLNLSSNGFDGNIPSSLANLTELESLDLSHNNLSGQIPPALGGLTSLSTVKVSHNKLVGPIPQGTQFRTQSASSFEGNLGLCGLPLTQKCGDFDTEQSPDTETEKEEDEGVLNWSAAAIALAPGVILGLTIGYIVISQKPHWFEKKQHRRRGSP